MIRNRILYKREIIQRIIQSESFREKKIIVETLLIANEALANKYKVKLIFKIS